MISSSFRRNVGNNNKNNNNNNNNDDDDDSPSLQTSKRRPRRTTTSQRRQQRALNINNNKSLLRLLVTIFVLCWSFVAYITVQKLRHNNDARRQQQEQHDSQYDFSGFDNDTSSISLSIPCWKNQTDNNDNSHDQHPPLLKFALQNPPKTVHEGMVETSESDPTTTTTKTSILHAVITPMFASISSSQDDDFNFHNNETLRHLYGHHYSVLQRSRLELLKSVCEPSLRYQTSQNMMWFVVVDDSVADSTMLEELSTIVESYNEYQTTRPRKQQQAQHSNNNHILPLFIDDEIATNAFIIGWRKKADDDDNNNNNKQSRSLQSWNDIVTEYQNNNIQILNTNPNVLDNMINRIIRLTTTTTNGETNQQSKQQQQQQPQHLMIVETMLDVDTALHYKAIEWIQTIAIQQQQQQQQRLFIASSTSTKIYSVDTTWWYLCSHQRYEWHNPDTMLMTQQDYDEMGISVGRVGIRHGGVCLSSGTTRIGIASLPPTTTTKSSSLFRGFGWADSGSNRLVFPSAALPPPYNGKVTATIDPPTKFLSELPRCTTINPSNCLRRISLPYIMTSRTVATTNLYNVQTASIANIRTMKSITDVDHGKGHRPLHHVNETELVWTVVEHSFGIDRYNIWLTSAYLLEHRESILLGQHPVCFVDMVSNNTTTAPPSSEDGCCPPKLYGILQEWIQYYHRQSDVGSPSANNKSKLRAILAGKQRIKAKKVVVLPVTKQ
jgi:hypothetical protein